MIEPDLTFTRRRPPERLKKRVERTRPPLELEPHRQSVVAYLRYLGCDAAMAEDVCQDVFLEALSAGSAAPSGGVQSVRGWLRIAARHRLIDRHRKQARALDTARLDAFDAVWQQRENDGSHAALQECLQLVSGRAREELDMRYRDGVSRERIAQELKMGIEGVKSLLVRVRAQLRDCMNRRMR